MKKFVLAPALTALALFVFGAVYWMSPFPYKALTPVGDNAAAATALAAIFPATGTYLIPGPEIQDADLLTELYRRGPSAEVQFIKEGHEPMAASVFIQGLVHYYVVALLLALLLHNVVPAFPHCYKCAVKCVTLVGTIGAVFVCLGDPIWWHHPWPWQLARALYIILGSLVAGLVLGKFFVTRPTSPVAQP